QRHAVLPSGRGGQVGLVRRPGVSPGQLHHPVDPDPSHQPQTPADHYRGRYAGGLWPGPALRHPDR
ncbi:hypothetical protein BBBGCB_BBBGCB_05370, partial [Dysosmobacter welbionis]